MVMLKVLMSYYEATCDARVLELMTNYFRFQQRMLPARRAGKLGRARGADNLLAIHWLYNWTGEPFCWSWRRPSPRRLRLGRPAGQLSGSDALLIGDHRFNMATHVVNNAQGIKTPAVLYIQTGDEWHRAARSWPSTT